MLNCVCAVPCWTDERHTEPGSPAVNMFGRGWRCRSDLPLAPGQLDLLAILQEVYTKDKIKKRLSESHVLKY